MSEVRSEQKVCFGASLWHMKGFWAIIKSPRECDLLPPPLPSSPPRPPTAEKVTLSSYLFKIFPKMNSDFSMFDPTWAFPKVKYVIFLLYRPDTCVLNTAKKFSLSDSDKKQKLKWHWRVENQFFVALNHILRPNCEIISIFFLFFLPYHTIPCNYRPQIWGKRHYQS